jgi:hypothetical protein
VTETTAQDAPGSTIAPWDDLRDRVLFDARKIARAPEAVDAAGPVDAQNAPTGPWKTADGFPQAPTAVIVFWIREKADRKHGPRPARQLRAPLRSPPALPLLTLRRQK